LLFRGILFLFLHFERSFSILRGKRFLPIDMKLSFHCIFLLAVITISSSVCQAKDRIYFLAIKEIIWDYAPTGLNVLTGNKLEDEK